MSAPPRRRVRVFGHRGAPLERPENSAEGFALALELGVDALESDVHLTKDGHVVLSHDDSGARMANEGRLLRDCTLQEVQRWDIGRGFAWPDLLRGQRPPRCAMPTLDALLSAHPDTLINLDIKQRSPSMVAPLLDVIARHNAQARVLLTSFFPDVSAELRAQRYSGPIGLGRNALLTLLLSPRSFLLEKKGLGHRAQVPVRQGPILFASRRFIDKCHAVGIAVDFWTINDPAQARELVALGADGIMTDDPRTIVPVVHDACRS